MTVKHHGRHEGFAGLFKHILPAPLRVAGRRSVHYLQRLGNWVAVLRQVRGRTPADQALLVRSARRGLATAHRDLARWHDPVLIADAAVEVPGVGRFDVRADSDDLYHVLPHREPAVFRAIRERIRAGGTFVDAGANIGIFTVLAGRLAGPTGRVVAIEMMPDTATRLRRHVALNGLANVTVIERALSDRSGDTVRASAPAGRFGQASIVDAGEGSVEVQTATLDDILAGFGTIDLMKVDVEGAELRAFAGGTSALARTRAVIFEQLADEPEVAKLLMSAGFAIRRLDGSNLLAVRPG